MISKYCIIVIFAYLSFSSAQYIGLSGCPMINTMTTFDPTQFVGQWYEAGRTFDLSQVGSKCVSANVTIVNGVTNGTLTMYHTSSSFLLSIPSDTFVAATPTDPTNGKYVINTYILFGLVPYSYPFWILNTDYTSYAILWSCSELIGLNGRYSWIWTRDRVASEAVLQTIYADLPNYGMDKNWFSLTDQGSCVF